MTETSEVDAIIDRAVKSGSIVGAAVLIAHQGQVVHEHVVGVDDRESGRPMCQDTVCRLASVTKPITAMTAMSLVDSGELDLTTPIAHWLPDFRPALASGERPAITVDQLLLHNSGLAYRMNEPADINYSRLGVSDGLDRTTLSLAESLDQLGRTTLRFAPGTDWPYSVSYDVLPGGLRVVDVTDRIFDPCQFPSGGAGIAGTAGDVLRFLEAVRTGELLEPATAAGMLVPRAPHEVAPGVHAAHARGWAVAQPSEVDLLGLPAGTLHSGSAYGHSWSLDPAHGTALVYFTNTRASGPGGAFLAELNRAAHRPVR